MHNVEQPTEGNCSIYNSLPMSTGRLFLLYKAVN